MIPRHFFRIILLAATLLPAAGATPSDTLWYAAPAKDWNSALPLGNGRLGTMVFGGVKSDRLMCNEISLWSGWPEAENDRPGAFAALEKVRQLIREGKRNEAGKLAVKEFLSTKGFGKPDFGAYQAFCDLNMDFDGLSDQVEDYRRDLDLSTATAHVSFRSGGVLYQREYFCNAPDQVSIARFTASEKGKIGFHLGISTLHGNHHISANNGEIILGGQVDTKDPAHEGMKFEARVIVRAEGGKTTGDGKSITVANADAVTILLVGATNYRLHYPDYKGEAPDVKNTRVLKALEGKTIEQLRSAHLADYQKLFGRVSLELGGKSGDGLPTDARLKQYRKSPDDRALEVLLFQYGRYLLISSSRPGGLPANLQGLWNNSNTPPWCCDYHLNINLQMNYWPAGPANLTECAAPLMDWLADLREPGAKTAKVHYNARGWVVHHTANVWGNTAPGSERGIHMMEAESAAFICQNVWDQFEFTRDMDFLGKTAWPLLKGAAEFWVDNLQEAAGGFLTVSPSFSPEHGPLTRGGFYQISIVRDLFDHCITAGSLLKTDAEFCEKLKQMRARLLPSGVGRFGQLREWVDDDMESENRTGPEVGRLENKDIRLDRHRHVSHLFAVYPGNRITPDGTPELAAAARQSLAYRGDGGTGWSSAWKMCLWARLHDGDHAWKLLGQHIAHDTLTNLWDSCPPFQIDGNFGYTAGVCEMLVQSRDGEIDLLPALPACWPEGSVRGLLARANLTVDVSWKNGKVTDYQIKSPQPREVLVRANGEKKTIRSRGLP